MTDPVIMISASWLWLVAGRFASGMFMVAIAGINQVLEPPKRPSRDWVTI